MKHLTDEAAQQLFVVLSKAQNVVDPSLSKEHTAWYCELANAIAIMQTAIDAPEPAGSTSDPTVAYMCGVAHGKESAAEQQLKALAAFGETQNQAPQARELSDAELDELYVGLFGIRPMPAMIRYARAVLAARSES